MFNLGMDANTFSVSVVYHDSSLVSSLFPPAQFSPSSFSRYLKSKKAVKRDRKSLRSIRPLSRVHHVNAAVRLSQAA